MENIFVEFLPPWIETGIQPAFYDKESGSVLQQTARMYARVNMLIRMFNKLSKETKETVENYIEQFNQLHDYVHDYFDNLDVQEEINNKLDAMAEAGTLQDIIYDYLNSVAIFCYDTVSDLKSAENLVKGSYVKTLGYHTVGDGGESLYKMSDTGTANEKDIIACQNDLVAIMIPNENNIYPEQFGAYGDGTTDDTTVIQYVLDNHNTVKFYNKTYLVKGLYVKSNQTLIGNNTTLIGDDTTDGIRLYNNTNSQIREVRIEGFTIKDYTIGIFAINVVQGTFKDILVRDCGYGAKFAGASYIDRFYNCKFNYSDNDGFNVGFDVTHPLINATVSPDTATMDFFSCNFYGNDGYGVNGWMRVFNFFGGYSENNDLGAVCLANKDGRPCSENSFIGFDIEQEDFAYVLESLDNTYIRVDNLNIIGGQMSLKEYNDQTQAIIYCKGGRPTATYTQNIRVNGRVADSRSDTTPNRYHIYSDSASDTSMQIDIDLGNINNQYLITNLTWFIPNGLFYQKDVTLPLRLFGTYYDETTGKVTLPANTTYILPIPNMVYVGDLTVTTESNMNMSIRAFGSKLGEFGSTGSATKTTGTENKFSIGINGNTLAFRTLFSSNSNVITDIKLSARFHK